MTKPIIGIIELDQVALDRRISDIFSEFKLGFPVVDNGRMPDGSEATYQRTFDLAKEQLTQHFQRQGRRSEIEDGRVLRSLCVCGQVPPETAAHLLDLWETRFPRPGVSRERQG